MKKFFETMEPYCIVLRLNASFTPKFMAVCIPLIYFLEQTLFLYDTIHVLFGNICSLYCLIPNYNSVSSMLNNTDIIINQLSALFNAAWQSHTKYINGIPCIRFYFIFNFTFCP